MCYLCEKNPVYEFTNRRKVCKNCFIKYFEKKFLYTIRKYNLIKREERLGYYEKKDFRSVVLKYLIDYFSSRAGNTILKITLKNKNTFDKIVLDDTADFVSKEFFNNILNSDISESKKFSVNYKNNIRPLFLFLDKEVRLYAELKGFKYKEISEKKNKVFLYFDELEKKHPEIKTSVISSYLKLFN